MFQCSPFTGKFYERSGQTGQVPARRRGGLSDLSDQKVIQGRAVSYLVLLLPFRVTNVKQAKRDFGENYLQTMQYRLQITTAKRLQVMEGILCNM